MRWQLNGQLGGQAATRVGGQPALHPSGSRPALALMLTRFALAVWPSTRPSACPPHWLCFRLAIFSLTAWLLVCAPPALHAQIPGAELTQVQVTREALEDLARRLDEAANSGAFSSELRARARTQAVAVRRRLEEGDFQVGDRIFLMVEGDTARAETLTIRAGRMIVLPNIGEVPLRGVLRSELRGYLTQRLSQFLRNPVLRAQALIRVTVAGAVGRQGFYTVPADIPVNDVLMVAGGPAPTAELSQIRIERGNETIYGGSDLQRIIAEGRTLDALSIEAGDQFVVPERRQHNPYQLAQTLSILLQIPFSLYGLIKLLGG